MLRSPQNVADGAVQLATESGKMAGKESIEINSLMNYICITASQENTRINAWGHYAAG